MNDVLITVDIDWSPDFMIDFIAGKLIKNNIKTTWFITHSSPSIKKLRNNSLFELGIHPNFLPGSSQGCSYDEVLSFLLDVVPDARCVRTHCLFQSSIILKKMVVEYGLNIDSSVYLRETPNIVPSVFYYDNAVLMRIPFFWTEDGEMYKPVPSFSLKDKHVELPGLKVFVFHPVHVFLNSFSMKNYSALKNSSPSVFSNENVLSSFINRGVGTCSFFDELVGYVKDNVTSRTLSDVCDEWYKREVLE